MANDLSPRKRQILQALVDSYITNAEPVSSSELKETYMPSVSSATIRSELAALEEMGYLLQPHVSAGRIPSAKAYKMYVDKLLDSKPLPQTEIDRIKHTIDDKLIKIEDVVTNTAKVISDMTNYTSIIVLKDIGEVEIREIKLIDIGAQNAIVIIITDSGVLKDNVIRLPEECEENYISVANGVLNQIFSGKHLSELDNWQDALSQELEKFRGLLKDILEILKSYSKNAEKRVFLEGTNKIFNYPEYNDIESAKNFLQVIEKKDSLCKIIEEDDSIVEFNIKIGKEDNPDLENCAIVTAKYSIHGKEIGQAGVIGPERMDYGKVLEVLKAITKSFDDEKR